MAHVVYAGLLVYWQQGLELYFIQLYSYIFSLFVAKNLLYKSVIAKIRHVLIMSLHYRVTVCRCECNGHSDICDKDGGDNCDCKNNTKSPRCETVEPTDALNAEFNIRPCWKAQVKTTHTCSQHRSVTALQR